MKCQHTLLKQALRLTCVLFSVIHLTSCYYKPPYNNFKPESGLYTTLKDTRRVLLKNLYKNKIEVVHYGDQVTLILPTDQYFEFNSAKLNDREYRGLEAVVKFIRTYPKYSIAVAAFSDNIGDRKKNLRLTDKRAHAMVAFLWANGINAKRLVPQGFADHYDVADNSIVRGRAFNRRLEIQWPAQEEILDAQKIDHKIDTETSSKRLKDSINAF